MNLAKDLKKKFTTGDPVVLQQSGEQDKALNDVNKVTGLSDDTPVGANQNPIPTEDIHSQETPVNQPGNVGPSNEPTETNDAISRYQKYVEGIQHPDLSSLLTGYDQQKKQAGQDVQKAESNRKWAALADLGNLVGGYIGARGGANVNVNPTNNEGVYNQAINKLSNTYRQFQSGRPDLVAKLALQMYNEQMQTAGGLYKGAVLSDKEKKDQFNQDYKLADLNQKIAVENNRFALEQKSVATAAQREKDQAEHNRILENLTGQRNNLYGGYLSNMDRRTQDAENAKKAYQPKKQSTNDVNWRKHNATPQPNTPADNDINGTLVNQ
jgi:hypothetical protein